jgi:hypothetical protein
LSADPPVIDIKTPAARSKIRDIDKQISNLRKQRAIEVKTKGNSAGVRDIDRRIAALKRKRHQVSVGVGLVRRGPQSVRFIPRGQAGGTMRFAASGTPFSRAGAMTWVGEQGPELMQLPTGSRVFSNSQSRAVVARRGQARASGGDTINIIAPPGVPYAFAKAVEQELVKLEQSRGKGGRLRFGQNRR